MTRRLVWLTIFFLIAGSGVALAQEDGSTASDFEMGEIVVQDLPLMPPGEAIIDPESPEAGVPEDTGEMLRNSVPGVTGVRMGGHGMDPVIRGQMGSRLNVLLDDAFIQGGCPNRMDPAISYAPYESYDRIIVLKGPRTVRYPGGSGGMIILERRTELLKDGDWLRGDISGAYADNGERFNGAVDATTGIGTVYLRGIYNYIEAENYVDGDYKEVPSSFRSNHSAFLAGWVPSDKFRMDVSYETTMVDDALYPGSMMDAPQSDNQTLVARAEMDNPGETFSGLRANYYQSRVQHTMDNYTLRERTAPMPMNVETSALAEGGRVETELSSDSARWTVGGDINNLHRDATRFFGPDEDNVDDLQSVLIPDARTDQYGVFTDAEFDLGENAMLAMGVRYDHIDASAKDTERDPAGMMMSPDQLYQLYYGVESEDQTEENIGGIIRMELKPEENRMAFINLSRVVRTADITERYVAANSPTTSMRWIGNPDLVPEQHHQLEIGTLLGDEHQYLSVAVYYDWVTDYILRDTARGQDGIERDDLAAIYRNVNAELVGGEIDTRWHYTDNLSSRVALAYVQAINRTDQRAVAQIPPLTAYLWLDYEQPRWMVGGRVRMTTEQTRVDDDPTEGSGLDAGETPGYGVVDVYSQVYLTEGLTMQMGIFNLLNHDYAEHLNKPNAFDPQEFQVNEPGQTVWLRLRAFF